jgi:hypothetical protein
MMTRTLSLALLLGSSLLTACTQEASTTTPGDDELAGESPSDGDKADGNALQDTFGIYTAQKVGAFECNGLGSCTHVDLALAGKSTTPCGTGGTASTACSVHLLDFSKLSLTSAQTSNLMDKLQASAATPEIGPQLLVRGKFLNNVDWITFQVTEVWVAQMADAVTDGTFVMMRENGRRCITTPCETLNESRLNSTRNLDMDGIDFPSEMGVAIQNKMNDATLKADGLIVVGDRTHGRVSGKTTTLRSVNQAFVVVK